MKSSYLGKLFWHPHLSQDCSSTPLRTCNQPCWNGLVTGPSFETLIRSSQNCGPGTAQIDIVAGTILMYTSYVIGFIMYCH